jgi:hypothetical protein
MNRRTLLLAALAFAVDASAADVAGSWKTSYTNEEGQTRESVLTLTMDGGKLSGAIASARGKVPLAEGSVDGNRISFSVVRKGNGDEIKITFTGTVEGDTMRLKMQLRDRAPIDMTAKRGL